MGIITGNYTYRSGFENIDVNGKNAEQANPDAFSDPSKVYTLGKEDQENILGVYLNDFEGYSARETSTEGVYYFSRLNDDGTTDAIRVVDDSGTKKVIHSTVTNGVAQTEVLELTRTDEFNCWASGKTVDRLIAGGEIGDFEMFDASGMDQSNYVTNVQEFTTEYLSKYDTDGNGLSLEEFKTLAMDGAGLASLEEYKASNPKMTQEEYIQAYREEYPDSDVDDSVLIGLYGEYSDEYDARDFEAEYEEIMTQQSAFLEDLFKGFQMDDDDSTISVNEFASQFIMSDIDWFSKAENPDSDYMNLVDGQINFYAYDYLSANPEVQISDTETVTRQDVYNKFFG